MKRFKFFHGASVSNEHATSFAQLQVKRDTGCRFKNETDRFRFREKPSEANAAPALVFLAGGIGPISQSQRLGNRELVAVESDKLACPFRKHANLKLQVASPPISAIPAVLARPPNGRRATDLPMVRICGAGGRPHRQDYPKRQGQCFGWSHIQLHQQWFAQRSRPKRAPRQTVYRERELFSF
jgi:hypothetical protein